MSGLCKEEEHSNLLVSLPVDKILNVDKNAESTLNESTDTDKDKVEVFKHKPSSIPRQRILQFLHKMYLVVKELAIICFVAITYAALTNDTPKLSKSPAAFPFFPKTSIVTDWYHGQLSSAIDKARESDISFVMFYAAWDAESQEIREEFDLAARYMQREVAFAAVNCWQPGSECRKQYSKAYSWPVLIAYPTHGKGIQYKGPRSAPYIIKFLKSVSRPFVRLYSINEVQDLLTKYDSVVVGCVDPLPGSYNFALFYNTALRFLEKDPLQEVIFAVLTESVETFCDPEAPSLSIHMWNETLIYPEDVWKSNSIVTWLLTHLHQVSMWITPTGSKSIVLSTYIQPGPALILFTPRNPLDPFVDYYDLIHEIGLEYCNCADNHVRLSSSFIHSKRKENFRKHSNLLQSCAIKPTISNVKKFPSVVTYTIPKKWANNSCCLSNSKISEEKCLKCDPMDLLTERIQSECERFKINNCNNLFEENLQDKHGGCEKEDLKSPQSLIKLWKREKCRIASIAHDMRPFRFSSSVLQMNDSIAVNVSGFACKKNGTIALMALDSLRYYHFAERLGVDLTKCKDKTAAVIINQKLETHHILSGEVNDETLREFIVNFTNNNLPRAYNSETTLKRGTMNIRQRTKSGIDVLELNTETFFPIVMQENKAVIVFYYSKQCSFCSGISYTLLTVAKLLSSTNSIQFTRVDGDLNVLPWAFTMDRYPTIILFPSRRKSESRVFPRDIPITVPNLISFILVNLNPSLKLHVMWTLCNQTKFDDEKRLCITSVREENLSVINTTLRAWRSADLLTKKTLLYKLQQLRNLNLLFGHSPEDVVSIERYLRRLHFAPTENVQTKSLEKDKQIVRDEL